MDKVTLRGKYIQALKDEKEYWIKRFVEEETGPKRHYIVHMLKDIYELSLVTEKEESMYQDKEL